ncbi:hypothetical protein H310_13501 [Aphanomyces invadans]|uniref:Peptidase C1A papain C-terminal domain-containing protein n=1 Tax=Aphanomyces invadans TaxID=157072 RepID=A0A024TFF9_9STRA|nr:hypothetical protein H310_13501 [Aphanomyces invadans]ETV92082.1 hypothetical protein H310_13501 [Aphanomyces invadans]|eukprot:XP_008879244.1 hypothetical protein H310_13501 [Aphanomyces invadans]
MKLFVALVAASAAASKQSVITLSADERSVLRAELAAWRKEFEPAAAAQGVLPEAIMSMSPQDAEEDALQRFYDNKLAIEEASRNNPDATFDDKNPFALMTQDEFKKFVEGVSLQESRNAFRSVPVANLNVSNVKAASMDWTTDTCIGPVRDQGRCRSCWAFAAVGAAEMAHCLVTGESLDLSEQQVTSCSTESGSAGCNGGWTHAGLTYASTTGLCLESDYPYTSGSTRQTGTCDSNSCTKKKLRIGATVRTSSEAELDTALNTQPVAVTVEAGNIVWKNYRRGVISQCPGSYSDHAVVAVGYDEESYKLRNSWGANWGDAGYIRLKRGVYGRGTCNIAEDIIFPNIDGVTPTNSPSTTTNPTPTPPRPEACGDCTGCFYPSTNECLSADHNKEYCDKNSGAYGMVCVRQLLWVFLSIREPVFVGRLQQRLLRQQKC